MCNQIRKAERGLPVVGMEGVVFRDPRYGPVEVVQVLNEPLANGRWAVSIWVKEASPQKKAFLEGCEVELGFVLQGFEARDAAVA